VLEKRSLFAEFQLWSRLGRGEPGWNGKVKGLKVLLCMFFFY
jgi:hypothetical protein